MRPRHVVRALLVPLTLTSAAVPPALSSASDPGSASSAYAEVLQQVVTPQGRVRYAALEADPAGLDAHLAAVASGDPSDLARRPEADRVAFWINAYNAITLKTIIDNYPVQPRGLAGLRYPPSSIRQIAGAWSDRRWTVLGRKMSLDDIEHETLRRQFAEPRVHVALVCAALGCPPLRSEPYEGARLASQLDDQARRYLASPAGLQLATDGRSVAVSAIFKWFAADFEATGGVRAFLACHAPEAARRAVADQRSRITYLDYDWSLNDARED
jgi:hypothetical protein